MAATMWSGFTEEDLRNIRKETDGSQEAVEKPSNVQAKQALVGKKVALIKSPSKGTPRRRVVVNDTGESILEPSQMLGSQARLDQKSKSNVKASIQLHTNNKNVSPDSSPSNGIVTLRLKSDGHSVELVGNGQHEALTVRSTTVKENQRTDGSGYSGNEGKCEAKCEVLEDLDKDNALMQKKLTLEEFSIRQKMIEEQNRRRRAMLSKAISDRKKKTEAETEKLAHIQKELQRLDSLVSNDVAILRNHIEIASMEFNEVQKRYEKVEHEFVEVKMELFHKMERKEQLTEHLCTIIEQNEMRKAKKLAQLMQELELESLVDDDVEEEEPVLPKLCFMTDVPYTTLREPKSAQSLSNNSSADSSIVQDFKQTEAISEDNLPSVSESERLNVETCNKESSSKDKSCITEEASCSTIDNNKDLLDKNDSS